MNGQKYYFQDDCSAVTGWYQEGDYWYYADAEGRMQKGPAEIEGKIYYFDGNYRLATGWVKLDNVWRFFDNAESHLERYELSYTQENGWMEMPYIIDGEIGWEDVAWVVPMNDTCKWEINWEWLYGKLPDGKYRIGKEITDFRATGDYDNTVYFVEFEIE